MRKQYDEQLNALHAALIDMGEMIQSAIRGAVGALLERDRERAKEIIAHDGEIDRQERLVESMCMKLLLFQHPVASDLRVVSAGLKVITDMERIGDHAADISELALMLRELPEMTCGHLQEMAAKTCEMLIGSIEAFVEQDMEKAHSVIAKDDGVDALFIQVKQELIDAIHCDPQIGEQATDLLMAAKYFERIGDHATNIAEWAIYAMTGEHVPE